MSDAVYNLNLFKKVSGVFGRVYSGDTGEAFPAVTLTLSLKTPPQLVQGPLPDDDEGFYLLDYKHKGKPAQYIVEALNVPGCPNFKAEVTLNGSSCSLRAVMVREEGAGNTRRADGVTGGPVTVLSMAPTGSPSCRITMPAKKPGAGGDKKPGDEKKPST